jgi:hypothetical protein
MKELKIVGTFNSEVLKDDTGNYIPYSINGVLKDALITPPQQGSNYAYMGSMIDLTRKFMSATDAKQETILLEKSEHDALIRTLKGNNFRVNDPAIHTFITGIEKLPDVEITKAA